MGVLYVVIECLDVFVFGCVIFVVFGVGLFGSVREVVAAMVRKSRVISLNLEVYVVYVDVYVVYL